MPVFVFVFGCPYTCLCVSMSGCVRECVSACARMRVWSACVRGCAYDGMSVCAKERPIIVWQCKISPGHLTTICH